MSLEARRVGHTTVAYNGYLYLMGGDSSVGIVNDVQYGPISSNGAIGGWDATTSFPIPRYAHTSVAYNGALYVIGGNNGGNLNDVQYATINTPAARSAYSKLL